MNKKQKLVLLAAAAAIALTSLFVPWDLSGSSNHTNTTFYRPIFLPPDMSVWSERNLSSSVPWTWVMITLCSGLLYVAARDPKPRP
jgi:hypothetical protein